MTITKTCSKCKETKPIIDFYKRNRSKDGISPWCKKCCSVWAANHYQQNKDKINEQHAKYRLKNYDKIRGHQREYYYSEEGQKRTKEYRRAHSEHIKDYQKKYRENNREQIRKKQNEYYHNNKDKAKTWRDKYRLSHKEQIKKSAKKYREENKEKINQSHVKRLRSDPVYKMKEQTRNMLRYALRSKGHHKTSRTADIIGCNLDFLCEYLFKTWEKNYGRPWDGEPYHIDHIVPLATAKTKEDIVKLCHYTNLQMLTPEDNMAKSDKV